MNRIPVSGPSIGEKEISYVTEAVRTAWYENANVFHQRFETAAQNYFGRKFVMTLPSCTSAIHLALAASGIGPGDEVIVPDLTWIATSAPISYVGATPVFADADAKTWCVTAATIEAAATPKTRAIITVNLYGGIPVDMDQIRALAARRGWLLIEDAAESIGTELNGRKAGTFGDVSVFSFHGSKTLTMGEGGLLLTDDKELFARASKLRDHGRAPGPKLFWNDEVAFKYKASSMQAALGLAQLERVDELVGKKRQLFDWYCNTLKTKAPSITLNAEPPGVKNSYWMITALLPRGSSLSKETLIARLAEQGVDSRPFFYPLSSLPAYADLPSAATAQKRNVVSYDLSPRGINLPSGLNLTADLVEHVTKALVLAIGGGA